MSRLNMKIEILEAEKVEEGGKEASLSIQKPEAAKTVLVQD